MRGRLRSQLPDTTLVVEGTSVEAVMEEFKDLAESVSQTEDVVDRVIVITLGVYVITAESVD